MLAYSLEETLKSLFTLFGEYMEKNFILWCRKLFPLSLKGEFACATIFTSNLRNGTISSVKYVPVQEGGTVQF